MDASRLLTCLTDDFGRLRAVAASDLGATVPSCPGWTVSDLICHVAKVYLHKSECIERRAFPQPWPPDIGEEKPLVLLDRAWGMLAERLSGRPPTDPAATWFEPDQTVGFWIRRMAQETVIHRVDAELALGRTIAPIPVDLAEDGIDEVLTRFLEYGSHRWIDALQNLRDSARGYSVEITSARGSWLVRTGRDGADVEYRDGAVRGRAVPAEADAVVCGASQDVLLWLWQRASDAPVPSPFPAVPAVRAPSGSPAMRTSGDPAALHELLTFLAAVTR